MPIITYNPAKDAPLRLKDMNGGPTEALIIDKGDSILLSVVLDLQGLTLEADIRLGKQTVTELQNRLDGIRFTRGW